MRIAVSEIMVFAVFLALWSCEGPEAAPAGESPDAGVVEPQRDGLEPCIENGFETLWDVDNLRGPIGAMALSEDGGLAVAGVDGSLVQWLIGQSEEDAPLADGRPRVGTELADEGARVDALAFGADFIVAGDVTGGLQLWNTTDGAGIPTTPSSQNPFRAVAVAPDDDDIIVADTSLKANLRVWNRNSDAVSAPLGTELWEVHDLLYTASGDGLVASGVYYGAYAIERWNSADLTTPTSRWIDPDEHDIGIIRAVEFFGDERFVAAVGGNRVMVFDAADVSAGPIALTRFEDADFNGVAVAGDVIVASGGDGVIRLLAHDLTGGVVTELAQVAVPTPVGVAVDSSGTRVISAGGDGHIRALGCVE
jgi:hypothetical protein